MDVRSKAEGNNPSGLVVSPQLDAFALAKVTRADIHVPESAQLEQRRYQRLVNWARQRGLSCDIFDARHDAIRCLLGITELHRLSASPMHAAFCSAVWRISAKAIVGVTITSKPIAASILPVGIMRSPFLDQRAPHASFDGATLMLHRSEKKCELLHTG